MFWGHDASWWGLVLGIAALMLAVPLSMIGNILTPVFLNWGVQISEAGLRREIAKKEARLADYEKNYELLTPTEDHLLLALGHVTRLILYTFQMVSIWLLVHGFSRLEGGRVDGETIFSVVIAISLYMMSWAYRPHNERLLLYRRQRSPRVRAELKETIEKGHRSLEGKK